MVSEIKMRTRFTLKKKEYDETIHRLRQGNAILQRLVEHSTFFETTRRAGSQSKLAQTIRNLSQSLFFAIRDTMGCSCSTHGIGLQLAQMQTSELIDEAGGLSGEGPHFEIIIERISHEQMQHWEGLSIHCNSNHLSLAAPGNGPLQTSPSTSLNDHMPRTPKHESSTFSNLWTKLRIEDNEVKAPGSKDKDLGKNVRFSIPASSKSSTTTPRTPGAIRAPTGSPLPIVNLCHVLHKGKSISNTCIGCITSDMSTSFDLYHRDCQPLVPKSITLREALLGRQVGLRDLKISERFHIALALSFGVLHLCNTPWLKKIVTLDDITFLREDSASNLYDFNLDRPCPFLVNQLTNATKFNTAVKSLSSSSRSDPRPVNFPVLSLGMLLTHVIAGRPVQEIEVEEQMSKQALSSGKDLALKQVMTCDDASNSYVEAVRWCLDNSFTFATLEAEDFRRDFHDAVIARLERDLSYLS